ncbi:MAG: hypothetical protein EXX96DRAFT_587901 [Benjaminiella poitrasii]|nr:MAG: hypothetical protein EXX96DRAFT_587901 [Benjaminiella poitrasii]
MSKHEQDRERLSECLLEAHKLVGEKVELTEEGSIKETLVSRLENLNLTFDENQPRSAFVDACLKVLIKTQRVLLDVCASGEKENSNNRDYLGVRDYRLIHTLLQVIISWGFYPCFLPGVGVPLSKRVKSGYTNHELLAKEEKDQTENKTISAASVRSLLSRVTNLVDLIAESEKVPSSKEYTTVSSILMNRHLPDLYAALLELAYAPASAFQSQHDPALQQAEKIQLPTTPGNMMAIKSVVDRQSVLKREERDKCARMFVWLFDRSDLSRTMESLMSLLGTSDLHPVPNWLRTICGRYLSRILLKPKGVSIVLDFTIGQVDQLQLAQLESIAKLILSVPQQMASIESYYAVITPQLLELLEREPMTSPTCQAVTFIIGRIIAKHASLAKTYIVDKIVGPLLSAWTREDYDGDQMTADGMDQIALSEDELMKLLNTLHRVLIGGEPSPDVLQTFLASSVPCLYHLYGFTVKSKSGLRETVLELLSTYFRITTHSDAIRELKKVVFDKVDLSGARVGYFAPGPTGGVVLRLRKAPKPLGGNEVPIDVDTLIEFLQGIENQDLCGDFFVFLLNEYSSLQSRRSVDPKVILLTLQLIMGMLDTIGPAILGKPAQIISFANNVIEDHVERMMGSTKEQENKKPSMGFPDIANIVNQETLEEELHDDQFSIEDDFESLVLAINLLRAVIHENDELDNQAVQLLTLSLEPLKKLENHSLELVQAAVNELLLAITSYLSAQKMSSSVTKSSLETSKQKYRDAMKSLQDDLLPIRAHGMGMLKEMALAKDPLVSSGEGLSQLLDIFIRLVQDEDSYIYLNAVKGLSAMTDAYGNEIIKKLGDIYKDDQQKLDNRLRIGEALLQTIQRCGDALGKYGKKKKGRENMFIIQEHVIQKKIKSSYTYRAP